MKLTFLIHDRTDYRGGPIVNMRRLLPELLERGHEIRILAEISGKSPTIDHLRDEYKIPISVRPAGLNDTQSRVRWVLTELQPHPPDVFVPNSFVYGFFAARWAREAGIPTLGYNRSDDQFHRDMAKEFVFGHRRWSLSGVACVSRHLQQQLQQQNPAHTQLAFLPSGIPIPKSTADKTSPGFRVCYIGRFEQEQKRFQETAWALFQNLENDTCTHVGFFGSGSLDSWLEKEVAARGLVERVTIHGAVAPEALHTALIGYHTSVLLSDYEGTPGAVMDAMAAGLVPVTTRIGGGTGELVEDNVTGLICDDRNKSFDCCLQRLGTDPQLRIRLAKAARRRIKADYSLETTVERFEKFTQQLLGNAGRKRSIQIPRRIKLPPVRGALGREDHRLSSLPSASFRHRIQMRLARYIPRRVKVILLTCAKKHHSSSFL